MATALATNMPVINENENDENEIELWRLKKLIKSLENHKGYNKLAYFNSPKTPLSSTGG